MTSPEVLTAVVIDWNLPDYTVRCVESLIGDGVPASRIVVVENEPTSENWSRIAAELSGCVLVRIDVNVGFARANNIGARALPGHAYLLVNNDAFVRRPGAVSALLQALGQPDIGIVVPKLVNEDGTLQASVVPFTTPLAALVRASGLSRFVPDRWQPHVGTHWSHGASREVEAAMGAVMLVDGEAWARLGGLRETSFMYAEDLDLCWRAHEHGWRTWFTNESEFTHLLSASTGRRWDMRQRWNRIGYAEAAMIREHLRPASAAAALVITQLGLAARIVCFTAMGKSDAAARYRGFMEGLRRARDADEDDQPAAAPEIEVVRPRG